MVDTRGRSRIIRAASSHIHDAESKFLGERMTTSSKLIASDSC